MWNSVIFVCGALAEVVVPLGNFSLGEGGSARRNDKTSEIQSVLEGLNSGTETNALLAAELNEKQIEDEHNHEMEHDMISHLENGISKDNNKKESMEHQLQMLRGNEEHQEEKLESNIRRKKHEHHEVMNGLRHEEAALLQKEIEAEGADKKVQSEIDDELLHAMRGLEVIENEEKEKLHEMMLQEEVEQETKKALQNPACIDEGPVEQQAADIVQEKEEKALERIVEYECEDGEELPLREVDRQGPNRKDHDAEALADEVLDDAMHLIPEEADPLNLVQSFREIKPHKSRHLEHQ